MASHAASAVRSARRERSGDVRGFSFPEIVLALALVAIVGAIGVPAITNMLPSMRVGMSARAVERQLQMARLKAVSTNRTIRVRFNCPGAGQYRMVELIGTPGIPAADDDDGAAATRCGYAKYPYPDAETGVFDIPNHDGPIQMLDRDVAFVAVDTIEFRPNGTAHIDQGSGDPWDPIPENAPVRIQVKRTDGSDVAQEESLKTIEVNGLGRIRIVED
jgi:prepilin-type N-terminal cleavage/methylation domain-containing protein